MQQDVTRFYFLTEIEDGALSVEDILEVSLPSAAAQRWLQTYGGSWRRGAKYTIAAGYTLDNGETFFPWRAHRATVSRF